MRSVLATLVLTVIHFTVFAQDSLDTPLLLNDSLIIDASVEHSKPKKGNFIKRIFDDKNRHSPAKATVLSLILPGAGQVYNKKVWKVPIVYAALGGTIYAVSYNKRQYKKFRTAYLYRVDDDPNTTDEYVDIVSNSQDLRTIRDYYRKNMELSYVGLSLVYILNATDAFVDAHLFEFDVGDDLSLRLSPNIQSESVGLRIGLHNRQQVSMPVLPF